MRTSRARRSSGRPGGCCDEALAEAGIERGDVYVTNAVKHFKFHQRGKRRIHQKPERCEITACHPWLEVELANVRPRSSYSSAPPLRVCSSAARPGWARYVDVRSSFQTAARRSSRFTRPPCFAHGDDRKQMRAGLLADLRARPHAARDSPVRVRLDPARPPGSSSRAGRRPCLRRRSEAASRPASVIGRPSSIQLAHHSTAARSPETTGSPRKAAGGVALLGERPPQVVRSGVSGARNASARYGSVVRVQRSRSPLTSGRGQAAAHVSAQRRAACFGVHGGYSSEEGDAAG